jgi:hypothetical protein
MRGDGLGVKGYMVAEDNADLTSNAATSFQNGRIAWELKAAACSYAFAKTKSL